MIEEDLKKRGLAGNVDKIALPGASKDLDQVTRAAEVSIRLHDPDLALIYEHEDCAAYGDDNSLQTHKNNAAKLAEKLKEGKPSLKVTSLIATFEGVREL